MYNWTQVVGTEGAWPEYEAKQPWMGTRMCLGDAGTNTQHVPKLGTTSALSSYKVMAKFGLKAYQVRVSMEKRGIWVFNKGQQFGTKTRHALRARGGGGLSSHVFLSVLLFFPDSLHSVHLCKVLQILSCNKIKDRNSALKHQPRPQRTWAPETI